MKTLIAVPCMDMVSAPFAQSLATLGKSGDCVVSFIIGSLIYESRDKLAKQAISLGADYVLWFDSDMLIPADTMQKMVKHMQDGKDFVTGLYFRRRSPYTPVIFSKLDIDGNGCTWDNYNEYPKDSVFEVEGCGFGCVMIKTEVLIDVASKEGKIFEPVNGMGEDLAFCHRARKNGYKIYCDSSIKLGHCGQVMVTEDMYDAVKG